MAQTDFALALWRYLWQQYDLAYVESLIHSMDLFTGFMRQFIYLEGVIRAGILITLYQVIEFSPLPKTAQLTLALYQIGGLSP